MSISAEASTDRTLTGIGLSAMAYGLFTTQDAMVKWLVEGFSVPQVLLMRSVVIVALAFALGGRQGIAGLRRSPHKKAMSLRAALILLAWLFYYSAARDLALAELSTLYFAAPVIVVALSVVILGEKVGPARWAIVFLGFGGVLLAADPTGAVSLVPAAMALIAAVCWAVTSVLVRMISRSETSLNQMLVSNGIFTLACLLPMPWLWQTPDMFSLLLMLVLGVTGGIGQYLLFEGFRHAPASVLAPVEYSALVWAFLLGFLVWGDVPGPHVFAGAAVIAASGLLLVWWEGRAKP
ncbi:MAG TPA: DMT family transporter [Mesorhizobium sp.]|jgi:S-adenosylmethionine uptake transporter|nr:DMT family transporter [Mesorhizobium sp.]